MNVLIFVITLLMLLSLMTYARLDVFRNTQAFQTLFNAYMERDERAYNNSIETTKFRVYRKPSKSQKEKGNKSPAIDATPRINISSLVTHKKKEEADNQLQQHTIVLLKNLMTNLYGDQPFFKEIQAKRPSFMDDIINALIQQTSQLPEDHPIKDAKDLANLKLDDEELEDAFYKMLHGAIYKDVVKEDSKYPQQSEDEEESVSSEDDQADQALISKEGDEYKSLKGYYSFLDFVTVSPKSKIRIYLAPRQVLQAIYGESVAEDIIRERQDLYKLAAADEKGENKKTLSDNFKNMFDSHKIPQVDESMLDYSVTKTNPKNY